MEVSKVFDMNSTNIRLSFHPVYLLSHDLPVSCSSGSINDILFATCSAVKIYTMLSKSWNVVMLLDNCSFSTWTFVFIIFCVAYPECCSHLAIILLVRIYICPFLQKSRVGVHPHGGLGDTKAHRKIIIRDNAEKFKFPSYLRRKYRVAPVRDWLGI